MVNITISYVPSIAINFQGMNQILSEARREAYT